MLVKIHNNVAINMLSIMSVMVRETVKTTTVGGGWFSEGKKNTSYEYDVEIQYKNVDNERASFKYMCHNNDKLASKIKDEVLSQVKELENVGATQALEEAIKNG